MSEALRLQSSSIHCGTGLARHSAGSSARRVTSIRSVSSCLAAIEPAVQFTFLRSGRERALAGLAGAQPLARARIRTRLRRQRGDRRPVRTAVLLDDLVDTRPGADHGADRGKRHSKRE